MHDVAVNNKKTTAAKTAMVFLVTVKYLDRDILHPPYGAIGAGGAVGAAGAAGAAGASDTKIDFKDSPMCD